MKYVIVSYNKNLGVDGDRDMDEYFELGWEMALSRMCLISMIKQKKFNPDIDVVVTNQTREFLYTNFCKNVVSYENFCNLKTSMNDEIYNLAYEIFLNATNRIKSSVCELWNFKNMNTDAQYPYNIEQAPEIVNFDLLPLEEVLKDDSEYICFLVRKRKWCSNSRNLSEHQIKECLDYAKKKNLTVYIMGKNTEAYHDPSSSVYHVSFRELASLINGVKCRVFLTTWSGGSFIRFFTGICKTITIDYGREYSKEGGPLQSGKQITFSDLVSDNKWTILNNFDSKILETI